MNGVINIFKPKGMTSFSMVAKVRKVLGVKKCGHTGTLDPLAQGVLPICVGHATRFSDLLMGGEKEYRAEMIFGKRYDTYDITGDITAESDKIPTLEDLNTIINSLKGDIELTVPAFSAKKINGKRAYKLAREGVIEDAGTAVMLIHDILLEKYDYPKAVISIRCSKGTYVRSIIDKIGLLCESYAAMSELVRIKNGLFDISTAITLEAIQEKNDNTDFLIPIDKALDLKKVIITNNEALKRTFNGIAPNLSDCEIRQEIFNKDLFLLMSQKGDVVSLCEWVDSYKPIKILKVFK